MSPGEDELSELLRRSHRDELLPLARELGIKPAGMGRDRLATAISRTLRRRGAHDLMNLVKRRGEGPSYEVVLRDLCARHQITGAGSSEETEVVIARWWFERAWQEMNEEQRGQLWADLELAPPLPEAGSTALERVREHYKHRFAYETSALVLGLVVSRIFPMLGCLFFLWLTRPRDDILFPAILEVHRLRQIVRHRVTVGVVGSPSSGKDAAVLALFGFDTGNVNPIAGSTTTVEIFRIPDATALYVVNTPGLGDVVESVTEEARQVLDHIDVYLYVVNAQGGVQAREKADWEQCRGTGRPALAIVNKIDTLRPSDRERYLEDARQKLEVDEEDFAAVAFDPLPQLSDEPIGLERVRDWLEQRLSELGKDPRELPWRTDAVA